ncbi:type I restriction endonuclease subunit R [Pontibacter arcticus]|uniref:Type I restriction enzyme endonuclease subunit n=1 Tax=Pontibacter arcticus TaxID=2080288 RepID=A0A364RC65_9BACT|nr:type I restriction endonuclease subunit R [Pontibacter arcticus]RAU81873.1 type I restriction endonuclease subunit R [Pontibacter arcticus]
MSQYLAEEAIEQAAIAWLRELEPYTYQHGSDIKRDLSKAVLEDVFEQFLQRRYPQVPPKVLAELKQEFLYNTGADLHQRNHAFHLKLSKGISKTWKDDTGKQHFGHFYPIAYDDVHQNEFLVVNQFTIIGKSKRIPDLIIFVNGLPLVLFEFKNLFNQDATVEAAYNQVQHYTYQIPQLFEYNALTIVSDGQTTLHGMYSSGLEWFAAWKSIDGREVVGNGFALETLIKGLLVPERLLQYVRHYIFHELDKGQLIKKGAKYHQFFGIQYALQETLKSVKPYGDGRIGVVWHTTRSGKSITMAIYTGILRQLPELKNPTIVVQVDRFDLNRQLFDDFVAAKDLVGDVSIANTTDELRSLLSGDSGGVVFSTVQKFNLKDTATGRELEHPVLSTRDNIIVIADECHRTQYGLIDGYANNLRRALPQASFIGFTGTPVDSKDADTVAVFGDIIHTYDIRQATEDKAVVPIYYEPRLAKLHLGNAQLEEEAEEITGGLEENEKNRILWAAMEDAAGSAGRVEAIAKDILQHYSSRSANLEGKAMIVCMSRRNCVKLYDALTALEGCPEVAVIMTTNIAKDPPAWNPHVRSKEQMEGIKARFKDPDDPLKLVIVRDMWLTGFDNPAMHTLYVDKVMSGHNLIQAVNRVATVFRDKPSGLIVDYIGIGDRLRDATKKYTAAGGEGQIALDIEEAFELAKETIYQLREMLPSGPVEVFAAVRDLQSRTTIPADLQSATLQTHDNSERGLKIPVVSASGLQIRKSSSVTGTPTREFASVHAAIPYFLSLPKTEKFKLIQHAVNHLVADDEVCKTFMLNEKILSSLAPIIKSHESINVLSSDIIYLQHVGAALRKAKNPDRNIRKSAEQVKNLIHRSIESEDVVDVFQMAGIERFDISIVTDEFLATAKEQKTGNELKLELLRQIMNDEIKVRSSKNLTKYRKLREEVERIIADYHNHFFDSLVAMEKLREVARQMQEEDQRRNQLGLTDEEEAFYEILANHPNAVQDFDLIKELVQKILAQVKKSASQPDWYKKDDTKAQLQLAVKSVLRFKVKAELQEILDEIMEQAEARYREYDTKVA